MVLCKTTPRRHRIDGPWAWLVCVSGALMNAVHFGMITSFSVLLPIWSEEFNTNRGTTAWIGSLTLGCTFLFSPITIKAIHRLGERPLGILAGIIGTGLIIASSFVNNIIPLYFSYGVFLGICGNITMNIAILSQTKYFKKRLALAIAIAGSGGSVGVLIFGPVSQALVDSLGWRNALRVLSVPLLVASLLNIFNDGNIETKDKHSQGDTTEEEQNLQQGQEQTLEQQQQLVKEEENGLRRVSKSKVKQTSRCFIDCSVWKSPKYTVGMITVWLAFFSYSVPRVHLISFAKDNNISGSKSSFLFTFIGVCSIISQIIAGKIIDKKWLTPIQGTQLYSLTLGISILLLTQIKEFQYFIPVSILYGLGNGGFVTAQTIFFLTCFGDLEKDATGFGIAHVLKAIALFVGAPIAGSIADYFSSYIPAFYIFGGLIIFASALPLCLWLKCMTMTPSNHVEEERSKRNPTGVQYFEYSSTV